MDNEKEAKGGIVMSIYFDPLVLAKLDDNAKFLHASRSWMVNYLLRPALGLQPEQDMKGGVKCKDTAL
jgi:hypothetical protein